MDTVLVADLVLVLAGAQVSGGVEADVGVGDEVAEEQAEVVEDGNLYCHPFLFVRLFRRLQNLPHRLDVRKIITVDSLFVVRFENNELVLLMNVSFLPKQRWTFE